MAAVKISVPSLDEMADIIEEKLQYKYWPCTFQVKSGQLQLKKRNVFTSAPTGSGKTLTFWIPLLFHDRIQILVTPLNILGDKDAAEIAECFGINAVNVTSETAIGALFKIRRLCSFAVELFLICHIGNRSTEIPSHNCQPRAFDGQHMVLKVV